MKRALCFVVLGFFATTPLFAQTPWIHVEIDDPDDDDTRVRVNLPLSVVEIAIEAAPDKIISDGELHLHHVDKDIDIDDLRKMWAALRESGDAEFVSIEGDDETVRLRRDGDVLRVDVDERRRGRNEQVKVEIPVRVVDALFSGDCETLNIKEALAQLRSQRGEIVRVDDGSTKVRIWIDEKD